MNPPAQRKVLGVSSVVEIGTGASLILAPGVVCRLLLGVEITGTAVLLGRLFGIALLCLGIACWPGSRSVPAASPVLGMLIYNSLIALCLVYLGVSGTWGILLWPAFALHAAIGGLLARGARR
jgi:hypothetical protein